MKKVNSLLLTLFMLAVLLTLTSCASVQSVKPDGSTFNYKRIGNQQIGRLILTDMETGKQIILEGQRANNDELVERITQGVVNGLIRYSSGGL